MLQDADTESLHTASQVSTQKDSQNSEYKPEEFDPEEGEEQFGPEEGEEEFDPEEGEEEAGKASYYLVSKERLWALLSKCQKKGCAANCDITTHTKGGQSFHINVITFYRSPAGGVLAVHSWPPGRLGVIRGHEGEEDLCGHGQCRAGVQHYPVRPALHEAQGGCRVLKYTVSSKP
jgi:hypothetical protein